MAYSILDRVYSIFIDIMTGISAGSGSATFYNTDKNTSYIELTVTNGVQSFNMSEYNYILVVNKPDKTSYKNSYSTTDNEKLVIALDSDMLSGIGTNSAQLYIMKSVDSVDKVITMIEFNYIVKPANYKELAPASKDSDSLYISLRNDVDSILQMIENGEIGGGGSGMTVTQKEQLATAYNHAMTDAVTTTDVVNSAVATYVEANKDTLKGDKGDKGDTGAKGADGAKGDKGDKGDPFTYSDFTSEQLAALKGAKGDKGDKGDKGEVGASGKDGITPTLRVGSTSTGNAGTNANVTMTDSNNVYTLNFVIPKGDKGDAGTKGQDGAKGADGITPTLKVGTVTTLAAGSNATVTMSKNNNEYTLNFGIPKGNKGDTGASGSGGETTVVNPTITIGTVTNGDTASATITGDSPNYTLNLVLPKGAKGDTGAKGADGAKGDKGDKGEKGDTGAKGADGVTPTFEVGTVSTGAEGSTATVTITGTAPNYVLNFTIPKGDKGDKGEKGDTGAKGDKGDPFTYADFTPEQLAALKGAKGDKGDRGETGADGVTPTLSIGTVTTGAAGSSASVTMGGTAPSYVINFTIPKGDKGDKGDTGASGSGGSSSGGGGIVFENAYVSDANQWLTNGYTKASGNVTANLPPVCTSIVDRWGILFFIAENAANGTGTQMFFPVDGKYMGKVFTRSIVLGSKPTNPDCNFGTWTMLASEDNIIEAVNGTSGAITLNDRMYQRVDATGNITITLPSMNKNTRIYKEIHLFYWSEGTYTVTVAATNGNQVLWESVPTIEANAITEFIFIGKGDAWMCRGITYRKQS